MVLPTPKIGERQMMVLKLLISHMGLTLDTLEPYTRRAKCPHITKETPIGKLTKYEANRLIDQLMRD